MDKAIRTAARSAPAPCPPVTERKAGITSRTGEDFGKSSVVDKTDLTRRDFFADPVRGSLSQDMHDISR